tara:strand:+ start:53 stop:478 length:426 start_codon:yes stop_codon:yes gene_type:complete
MKLLTLIQVELLQMNFFSRKFYIYLLLLFFLIIYFKLFESSYIVLKYDHETRLTKNYGYCERSSYGYVKYIEKKFKPVKNVKIINDEVHPSSDIFIHKPGVEYYDNYLILLNYNDQNSQINISDFTILDKYKNCLYLKKND